MIDDRIAMLTGSAAYVADSALKDPWHDAAHAVFVRSHMAHARFSVDFGDVATHPGVLAAIDGAQNPVHPTIAYSAMHPPRFAQPLLAEQKVRYVGEPIAVIVATTLAEAIDAAEHVVVDYEPLAPVVDVADSAADRTLLFGADEHARRNALSPNDDSVPTNVLRTAADDGIATWGTVGSHHDITVELTYECPRQLAAPIECRGALARWDGGELFVVMSTQTPHSFRNRMAPMYGTESASIHVLAGPFVGGGFGGKGAPGPEEQLVPHLARLVGRPVQWIERRTENLTGAPQGRAERITVHLAGTATGRFDAIDVRLDKDAGAYPSSGAGLPGSWTFPMAHGPYDIAAVGFDHRTVVTNRPPVSALRGAGRAPVIAAIERAVDRYAAAIDLDPAELRRRNLIRPEAMPYDAPTGFVFDDADYPAALERALELADYASLRAEQEHSRAQRSSTVMGIGIGCYNHRTCGPGGERAVVHIEADGSAVVATGTTSQGQDHATTWRTIASAELGIAPDRIVVIEGDTDAVATGIGAIGSRSVQTAGLAIVEASRDVVDQARRVAGDLFEAAEADVVFDVARASFHVTGTPARSLGWVEIAEHLDARSEQLRCDHLYENDGRDVYPSGSHLAVVDLDVDTGAWSLRRFIGVDDAGVRINPAAVEGQLHGGIALGVAHVLGECALYDDDGQPLAATFLDYAALAIDQVPQFELDAQVVPSSFNSGGWKAVGESGPIGAAAAVHNAVIDALAPWGVEHLDLPLTPERVWRAMQTTVSGAL